VGTTLSRGEIKERGTKSDARVKPGQQSWGFGRLGLAYTNDRLPKKEKPLAALRSGTESLRCRDRKEKEQASERVLSKGKVPKRFEGKRDLAPTTGSGQEFLLRARACFGLRKRALRVPRGTVLPQRRRNSRARWGKAAYANRTIIKEKVKLFATRTLEGGGNQLWSHDRGLVAPFFHPKMEKSQGRGSGSKAPYRGGRDLEG